MPVLSCRFWIRICRIYTSGGRKIWAGLTTLQRCYADYSSQRDRIYLLCRPDIPKFDPLRENPGIEIGCINYT